MRDSSKPSSPPLGSGPVPRFAAASPDSGVASEEPVFQADRGILTPKEIETLLRPARQTGTMPDRHATAEVKRARRAHSKSPSGQKPGSGPVNALAERIGSALSCGAAMELSVKPRESADFDVASLGQLMSGTPVIIAGFGRSDTRLSALVCLPLSLANALISQIRTSEKVARKTDLSEQPNALDLVILHKIIAALNSTFGDGVRLQAITTELGDVADRFQTEEITITEYDVTGRGVVSDLAVVKGRAAAPPVSDTDQDVAALPEVPIIALVTARLSGFRATLGELKNLSAGSILMLGPASDAPVEILSGGRTGPVISHACIGRRGGKMALKVEMS